MDSILVFFCILIVGPVIVKKFGVKVKPISAIIASHVMVGSTILLVAYVLYNEIPSQEFIKEKSLPSIPILIGFLTLILTTFLVLKKQKPTIEKADQNDPIRCLILGCFSWLFIIISKYGFLISIYYPKIFNSGSQFPLLGVWAFIIGNFFSAFSLHFFSRCKHIEYPEIYFWESLLTMLYCVFQTTLYSFVLSHGLIKDFSLSYPYYANLICLSYFPLIIVIFLLAFRHDRDKEKE